MTPKKMWEVGDNKNVGCGRREGKKRKKEIKEKREKKEKKEICIVFFCHHRA